ncbi:hypothetical protein QOZ80_3AG0221810 [Eleusine coracana subsp. coracana]|nr:hypothetical protein QOZ80_3AG0221810 [Eleusine coracana subsp. coracana]
MAAARRLSELLQEQQEPFLIEAAYRTRRPRRGFRCVTGTAGGGCCPTATTGAACRRLLSLCNNGFKKRRTTTIGGLRSALSKVLCGRAMRRVLRWEDLAAGGCFSGAGGCGGREFRRLRRYSGECDPRAMEFGWKDDVDVMDSSRQLSPVSVLDLRSDHDGDDSSPVYSHWDDEKPSTSGSSPPSDAFLGPASPCFSYNLTDKFCEMDVDESDDETVSRTNTGKSLQEQISSWEKIAGDISRIPSMMELDVQQSVPQWREHRPEVAEIGSRIETLIFEDIRREAVCDMLASHCVH